MDARSKQEFSDFVAVRSMHLLRVARALTDNRQQAEDLVQDALAKLAGRWRHVSNPEAYVRRVLYHSQVNWWRRRSRVRETPTLVVPDQVVSDATIGVDRRLDIQAALALLGRRQRAVLVLRYLEDLPEADVAEILGCSVGTVRSQTHRALARLRTAPGLINSASSRSEPAIKEAGR